MTLPIPTRSPISFVNRPTMLKGVPSDLVNVMVTLLSEVPTAAGLVTTTYVCQAMPEATPAATCGK